MKVSNPLTIIAIFSGLAETLATVALIQLPLEMQKIFIYFVIAFPTLIVLLFFYILYFKNSVLYAPSDYTNPEHYLLVNEIKEKVSIEIDNTLPNVIKDKYEIQNIKNNLKHNIYNYLNNSLLSNRESQIYVLMEQNKSSREIAEALGISDKTVRTYMSRIKEKIEPN